MKFRLSAILSISDGRLFGTMDEVYSILNFMTGDDLTTIALVPAAEQCKPALLAQHPQLAEFKPDNVTPNNYLALLAGAYEKFGKELDVQPLACWDVAAAMERIDEMLKGKDVLDVKT